MWPSLGWGFGGKHWREPSVLPAHGRLTRKQLATRGKKLFRLAFLASELDRARMARFPHHYPSLDKALGAALLHSGSKVELTPREMRRLKKFLHEELPRAVRRPTGAVPDDAGLWDLEADWLDRWEKQFGDLTPADSPFCFDKLPHGIPINVSLDGRVFGATSLEFGRSQQESVLGHALNRNLPSLPMLVNFWDARERRDRRREEEKQTKQRQQQRGGQGATHTHTGSSTKNNKNASSNAIVGSSASCTSSSNYNR